jgi:hypothetical protein
MSFKKDCWLLFNYLGTCGLCLNKLPHPKILIDSPVYSSPGESIMNTNNSTNIRTKTKSFLVVPIGTRRSRFKKKKTETKNSLHCSFKKDKLCIRHEKPTAALDKNMHEYKKIPAPLPPPTPPIRKQKKQIYFF